MDIKLDTTPGRVQLMLPTDKGDATLDFASAGAARLGFVLLHHVAEAEAKFDPATTLGPDERRATPHPVQISETAVAPDGSIVLKCETPEGLTFHLAIAAESARSLAEVLATAPLPPRPGSRQ
ncbi:hypothetical protein [Methylobacterium sp. B1]|uniref:hypothetical protein n=1 Tax=Methylobacterium sp. B1 TaxID=91459 RepID=UPI00034DF93F|nr:hypothetical protein [Methylobacterium sp. B1]